MLCDFCVSTGRNYIVDMVNLNTTNIVGSADKKTWSQSQSIVYGDNHQVLMVIQLTCEDSGSLVDLTTIGVEMLTEIEIKGQAIETGEHLEKLVQLVVEEVAPGLHIDVIIASLKDDRLILCGSGSVEAYLSRNGKLAKLRDGSTMIKAIEGTLIENDVVVLSTNQFVQEIGVSKFKQILTEEESPAELLGPLLRTKSVTSHMAAIIGELKTKVEPAESDWVKGVFSRDPIIRLRNEAPRKINMWIGGVILLLLIIMIGIGMVRRVKQIAENDFNNLYASVNSKVEETMSIGDLNPERARILLSLAKGEVESYLTTDIRDEYKARGQKLLSEIERADEVAFKKNDTHLTTIVELPILVEELKADKMKSDGKGNLIFSDPNGSKIVLMNLVDRSRQVIDIPDDGSYIDVGIGESQVFGLSKEGVTQLFWKKEVAKKVIEPDEFWKEPSAIEMFAGNAYILDISQGEIWKYPTLGDTFGARRRWLAVGITPDLTNVVDMKVVGDIWLLTSTGKLERYSRGAPTAFGMEGFPAKGEAKRLSEPSALWVTDSMVYVLENGASRVVVFGVDGKYKSQYVNTEFGKASDLVVVDDKGYILIDNVVKEFGL